MPNAPFPSSAHSVTCWLGQLQAGDNAAAQPLWERYFERLVRLAQKKLAGASRRAADGEDVALSAFDSFCRGVADGRFPRLDDRDNLWALLVRITANKAADLVKHERRLKRGGGQVIDEAGLGDGQGQSQVRPLEQVAGAEPTPEFAAQAAEELGRLLGILPEEERRVAVWKMEGYTNKEIAERLGCSVPTVERRLRVVRKTWEGTGGGE